MQRLLDREPRFMDCPVTIGEIIAVREHEVEEETKHDGDSGGTEEHLLSKIEKNFNELSQEDKVAMVLLDSEDSKIKK